MTREHEVNQGRGFSLIELMVVVAIIAIIAAVAIPSYGRYVFRARRADGQALLMHIANAQERYYAVSHRYGDLLVIGFSATTTAMSEAGHYMAHVELGDDHGAGQSYVAKAVGQGAQAGDACGDLSIDDTGNRSPASTDTSRNSNGRCW